MFGFTFDLNLNKSLLLQSLLKKLKNLLLGLVFTLLLFDFPSLQP